MEYKSRVEKRNGPKNWLVIKNPTFLPSHYETLKCLDISWSSIGLPFEFSQIAPRLVSSIFFRFLLDFSQLSPIILFDLLWKFHGIPEMFQFIFEFPSDVSQIFRGFLSEFPRVVLDFPWFLLTFPRLLLDSPGILREVLLPDFPNIFPPGCSL